MGHRIGSQKRLNGRSTYSTQARSLDRGHVMRRKKHSLVVQRHPKATSVSRKSVVDSSPPKKPGPPDNVPLIKGGTGAAQPSVARLKAKQPLLQHGQLSQSGFPIVGVGASAG